MTWKNAREDGFPKEAYTRYLVAFKSDLYLCELDNFGNLEGCNSDGDSVSLSEGWDFDYLSLNGGWKNSKTDGFPKEKYASYLVEYGSDVFLCELNEYGSLEGHSYDGDSVSLSEGWNFDYLSLDDTE